MRNARVCEQEADIQTRRYVHYFGDAAQMKKWQLHWSYRQEMKFTIE